MPLQIEITPEFKEAFELICHGKQHLFITGNAGTGKSTLLDYCRRNCKKNLVVLAPTGVAALNVQGQTIHRFFGFPVNVTPEKIKNFQILPRAKRIYKQLQTLIIDEASMLRADLLDCIDAFLRLYGPDAEQSFGGVQVVLVGDLYQLPPVISSAERSFFASRYETPYFFSAEVCRSINLRVIELNKIYRQKDARFIELLSRIRHNTASEDDIKALNARLHAVFPDDSFCISLTTTNQMADKINMAGLNKINAPSYLSHAVADGSFKQEYYPAAEELELKTGAQIMFLNNDMKGRWVNGTLGLIEDIKSTSEKIRFLRVRLQENQKLVDVFPYTWEIYKFSLIGKEIVSEPAGSFTQFPLRLAWAVTIHKSQGKTFDRLKLDIGSGTFAPGQLYVALSRCTSFEGLCLEKPVSFAHILSDERIVEFMHRYTGNGVLSDEEKIRLLQKAALNRQKLEILYRKANGETSRRIIIPTHIKGENVQAFCIQRQQQRSFNISRIEMLKTFVE